MPSAILLVAHGSRRAEANQELVELAEQFKARFPDEIIEFAYLELEEPTIPQGLRNCAQAGASSISVLPFFLSPGSHVTRDLARFRDEFRSLHTDIDCHVCPPIGLHPKLIDILIDRLSAGRHQDGTSSPK